jgi:hypothetical protein
MVRSKSSVDEVGGLRLTGAGSALLLLLITLVGGGLRLAKLSQWPVDGDEVLALNRSEVLQQVANPEESDRIRVTGFVSIWAAQLLQPAVGDPVLAQRLVSVAAGTLAIPLLAGLMFPLWGSLAALSAALLLAFSPLHYYMSTHSRFDSTTFLAGACASLWTLRALQLGSRRALLLGSVSCGVAAAAHSSALFVVATLLMVSLLPLAGSSLRRRLRLAFLMVVCGQLLFLFGRYPGACREVLERFVDTPASQGRFLLSLSHDLGLSVPVLAVVGVITFLRGGRPFAALVVLVTPLLLCLTFSTLAAVGVRHTSAALPMVYVFAALGMARLLERLPSLRAGLVLAGVILVPPLPVFVSQWMDNSRYDLRAVANALSEVHRPGEPVFSESHAVLQYYSAIPCAELPGTGAELEAALPAKSRAFVALLLQRGTAIGAADRKLQDFVERRMQLLQRTASRRLDMHRFETRLYLWDPLVASRSLPPREAPLEREGDSGR